MTTVARVVSRKGTDMKFGFKVNGTAALVEADSAEEAEAAIRANEAEDVEMVDENTTIERDEDSDTED